jgi:putative spermidine/putrescine transport system permease protein
VADAAAPGIAGAAGRAPLAEPAGPGLRRALARAERRRTLVALGLIAPLLAFLLAFFLLPIGGMLVKAVGNDELRTAMPATAAALRAWDGAGIPPEPLLATFAAELRAALAARTLAPVAQRLNVERSGWRTTLMTAARRLPAEPAGSWAATLAELDPDWADPAIWAALRRAAEPWTDRYLLAALDLARGADDRIGPVAVDQAIYRTVMARTFWIAAVVTLACLILGYPLAYRLATLPEGTANLLLILVLLPFWTSLLVRTAAWIVLLQREGPVNETLQALGLIAEPLRLVYARPGVYVAMTHVLLPFMVLPLYAVMRGIPPAYGRAALSLGATPWTAFRRVFLPLSMPGVGAGCLLVFILALGYYITPALVGGAADQMISSFVAFFTLQTVNWGMAAALGTVLLAATVALYLVYARLVGIDRLRLG